MVVDFGWAKNPKLRVASIAWKGPWSDAKIRAQFEKVERWAKAQGLRTGRWIFQEPGNRRWEAAIEVKGSARGAGPVVSRPFGHRRSPGSCSTRMSSPPVSSTTA